MKRLIRFARVSALSAALVSAALLSASAWAYIPPSAFILKSVVQKRANYKSLRIRSVISDGASGSPRFKTQTSIDFVSRRYRVSVSDPQGQELAVLDRTFSTAESAAEPKETSPSIGAWVLLSNSQEGLARELITRGVPLRTDAMVLAVKGSEEAKRDIERLGLRRVGTIPAWVIGEEPLPTSASASGKTETTPYDSERGPYSQLWVTKDTFLPARVVLRRENGERDELRFENFRFVKEFPFPRELSYRTDGGQKLKVREEVQDQAVDVELPELKQSNGTKGWTQSGRDLDSAQREVVRLFLQFLR